ncbi:glycosyltransferase family 2 protein [Endozoicomonas gorgoniicola]|uniref:Glycosyltransferase family 2 protein n=1 Tax=Endozoicomonas gorgoniicola TaxID=1234144 RepID=A0ABT3MS53_9GAMM|nr:glycosyltransferase family 2 protein [Endozoicomonas gorgoniicola]MCW7552200.1 glycosyltransferase family 2 protein [Endozoicomonas gorgoniicola]
MINVVIPMAGAGSRFVNAGFIKPKPFIDVNGKPMIIRVLENINLPNARYILIAQRKHLQSEVDVVKEIKKRFQATFVEIDGLTEGTVCTVLHSRKLIDNDTPLLIANSDQLVDFEPQAFVSDCISRNLDGSILTFVDKTQDSKWSFARIDQDGLVQEVKEKEAISEFATVGIYFFRKGGDFIDASISMILHQDRVNGEYYTCPTYNYLIAEGKRTGIFNIPPDAMHGIGTPDDLQIFLSKTT